MLILLSAWLTAAPGAAETTSSGLPIPRFVSLAAERINMRTGPGKQYPIVWIYARAGLPVKIVSEFETWRQIEDHEGDQGWIHVSLLSGRRTVLIREPVRELHKAPGDNSAVLLRAEAGVLGRFVGCRDLWCEVEIDGDRGWIERAALWGVLDGESAP